MYLFYSQFLIRSQGSSEIRQADLIGLQAEVTVPIGETSMGQVTYLTKSGRMSSMARSIDGKAIPRGRSRIDRAGACPAEAGLDRMGSTSGAR